MFRYQAARQDIGDDRAARYNARSTDPGLAIIPGRQIPVPASVSRHAVTPHPGSSDD